MDILYHKIIKNYMIILLYHILKYARIGKNNKKVINRTKDYNSNNSINKTIRIITEKLKI